MSQPWHKKATVQSAIAGGVFVLLAATIAPVLVHWFNKEAQPSETEIQQFLIVQEATEHIAHLSIFNSDTLPLLVTSIEISENVEAAVPENVIRLCSSAVARVESNVTIRSVASDRIQFASMVRTEPGPLSSATVPARGDIYISCGTDISFSLKFDTAVELDPKSYSYIQVRLPRDLAESVQPKGYQDFRHFAQPVEKEEFSRFSASIILTLGDGSELTRDIDFLDSAE
jgi:hypothetical protein